MATCEICGHRWDMRDPGITLVWGDMAWECTDESACFERKAMAALDAEREGLADAD
jgi:hypothetical protein